MNTQIQQKIIESLQGLDSFQLSEVSDFVEFIHCKRRICMLPDFEVIDQLCGKYRDRLSSSQEFAIRKQVEIGLEEQKWQKR